MVQKSGEKPVEVGSLAHYLRRVLAPSKRWLGMGYLNHQQISTVTLRKRFSTLAEVHYGQQCLCRILTFPNAGCRNRRWFASFLHGKTVSVSRYASQCIYIYDINKVIIKETYLGYHINTVYNISTPQGINKIGVVLCVANTFGVFEVAWCRESQLDKNSQLLKSPDAIMVCSFLSFMGT